MGDNKEIVKCLSHMNPDASCTTVSNTTLEKQRQVDDGQRQILYKMNARTENPNLQHLLNAIAETSAEDTTRAKEVSELFNKLDLSLQSFANDVREDLHKVSTILRSYGLTDTDETALIISVDGRRIREQKRRRINRELKAKYTELLNRHSVLERKLNYLKENVGLIKNSIAEEKIEYKNENPSYELLIAKLTEYNAAAAKIETDIDSLNLMELEPDNILDKYKKFMEKKGQLAQLDQDLALYSNLPPNLLQAKALLESKELEYNEITMKLI